MYIFLGGTLGHSMDSMSKAKYNFLPKSKEADGVVCTLFIRTNRIKEYDQYIDKYKFRSLTEGQNEILSEIITYNVRVFDLLNLL